MLHIKLAQSPKVKDLCRAVGSKKHNASVSIVEAVSYTGTFWDGGSRSEYTAVCLSTGKAVHGPQFNPPQFGGPKEDLRVNLPQGFAIVEHGTFMGKPATPHVYIHPLDAKAVLGALLPAPKEDSPKALPEVLEI